MSTADNAFELIEQFGSETTREMAGILKNRFINQLDREHKVLRLWELTKKELHQEAQEVLINEGITITFTAERIRYDMGGDGILTGSNLSEVAEAVLGLMEGKLTDKERTILANCAACPIETRLGLGR